jgi:hypothetical protein
MFQRKWTDVLNWTISNNVLFCLMIELSKLLVVPYFSRAGLVSCWTLPHDSIMYVHIFVYSYNCFHVMHQRLIQLC